MWEQSLPEPCLALLLRISILTWRTGEGSSEWYSGTSAVPSQQAAEKGVEPKSSCSQNPWFSLCTAGPWKADN